MPIPYIVPVTILAATVTVAQAFDSVRPGQAKRTFQVTMTAGSTSCSVVIEGSNDDIGWVPVANLDVVVSDNISAGVTTDAPWRAVRANVTALTGTIASITMGT